MGLRRDAAASGKKLSIIHPPLIERPAGVARQSDRRYREISCRFRKMISPGAFYAIDIMRGIVSWRDGGGAVTP